MKLKTNDKVKVLTGKDKGKTGKIVQVMKQENKVVVEGLNILVKHLRRKRAQEKGQKIQFSAPMNLSNVALLCPHCGKTTRIGYHVGKREGAEEKTAKKKYRMCKQCKQPLDS